MKFEAHRTKVGVKETCGCMRWTCLHWMKSPLLPPPFADPNLEDRGMKRLIRWPRLAGLPAHC